MERLGLYAITRREELVQGPRRFRVFEEDYEARLEGDDVVLRDRHGARYPILEADGYVVASFGPDSDVYERWSDPVAGVDEWGREALR
ncbi:MAG: hypothetical protein HN348_36860, partial [Proteobacteria bacterium]|nr:hypothetical protein [Pseudomonadota bacterium]